MTRFLRRNWTIRGDVVTSVYKIVLCYFIASKKSKNYHLLWFLVTILKILCFHYIIDKFKVVFTKDNEENYYAYFDEKADEKKTTSFKENQQFIKGQVDYEYYESLDNFKIKDLSKNKNKHKEETVNNETDKTTVDELQKKLDELKKKENTKKEVSDKENSTEQLQKELNELKKKIDEKNSDE